MTVLQKGTMSLCFTLRWDSTLCSCWQQGFMAAQLKLLFGEFSFLESSQAKKKITEDWRVKVQLNENQF